MGWHCASQSLALRMWPARLARARVRVCACALRKVAWLAGRQARRGGGGPPAARGRVLLTLCVSALRVASFSTLATRCTRPPACCVCGRNLLHLLHEAEVSTAGIALPATATATLPVRPRDYLSLATEGINSQVPACAALRCNQPTLAGNSQRSRPRERAAHASLVSTIPPTVARGVQSASARLLGFSRKGRVGEKVSVQSGAPVPVASGWDGDVLGTRRHQPARHAFFVLVAGRGAAGHLTEAVHKGTRARTGGKSIRRRGGPCVGARALSHRPNDDAGKSNSGTVLLVDGRCAACAISAYVPRNTIHIAGLAARLHTHDDVGKSIHGSAHSRVYVDRAPCCARNSAYPAPWT